MSGSIKVGYHTGGLLHHDLPVIIGELASLGFASVAVRPSAANLDVRRSDFENRWRAITSQATTCGVQLILDLDGVFLTDPYRRRGPSWIADDSDQRGAAVDWIVRWCEAAADSVRCVTLASRRLDESERAGSESLQQTIDTVGQRIAAALDRIEATDVSIALRPVAGDAIATIPQYAMLTQWLGVGRIGLAADVGEMIAAGEFPIADRLNRCLSDLRCVYVCDRGNAASGHDELTGDPSVSDVPIGSGEVATERILQTLSRGGYAGPAVYRVFGHAGDGLAPARQAIESYERITP